MCRYPRWYSGLSPLRLAVVGLIALAVGMGIAVLVLHLVNGVLDPVGHHDCPRVYVRPRPDLVVRRVALGTGVYDTGKVAGVIVNDSNVPYAYVRVQVELLGRKGDLIDTASLTVYRLEPHHAREFRIPVSKRGVSSVRVRQVMGVPAPDAPPAGSMAP